MSDDKKRPGIGKVIYSVDDEKDEKAPVEKRAENADIEEADAESFPASDPPGFAGGKPTKTERAEE